MKKINGDVFCVKKAHLAGYLMMNGFNLKRMPKDEKNPDYNVFIFNNSIELEKIVDEYFKEFSMNN
ncbi:DUF5659 domain-containing protein [Clostridium estertheticum]|uniref:DUF5659 domain-containing protein n=1 Tax=Clostridium estertheticum TaxID=238834 RepID=UPI00124D3A4E|nr:DUF5659 domain-containing protein [Clostridium estertheticum]MBZ9616774.1 DUF5659 domain-containing protein [Clostridium estertheticum subsp. laramiense]WAG72481.1 DUF5659 domain-containing protein [Clostridium estertheticum]